MLVFIVEFVHVYSDTSMRPYWSSVLVFIVEFVHVYSDAPMRPYLSSVLVFYC